MQIYKQAHKYVTKRSVTILVPARHTLHVYLAIAYTDLEQFLLPIEDFDVVQDGPSGEQCHRENHSLQVLEMNEVCRLLMLCLILQYRYSLQ